MDGKIPTTERLAKVLEEQKAPGWLVANARKGMYDDFKSTSAVPQHDLVHACRQAHLSEEFVQRVFEGEFDSELWEAEEWINSSEGREALRKLGEE